MMDIDQVMRRWLVGEGIRDRNTLRRIVRLAEEAGIRRDMPWPDEGKLQAIRQGMGRPGAVVAPSEAEQRLKPRTDQMRTMPRPPLALRDCTSRRLALSSRVVVLNNSAKPTKMA
jgi:hypothetical protein